MTEMTNVLVKTQEQFAQFVNARSKGVKDSSMRFFIEEDLFVEFSEYAVVQARKMGFLIGVSTALAFVVVLGIVAKIIMWW
jgi:type III secretory pathway component EscR